MPLIGTLFIGSAGILLADRRRAKYQAGVLANTHIQHHRDRCCAWRDRL